MSFWLPPGLFKHGEKRGYRNHYRMDEVASFVSLFSESKSKQSFNVFGVHENDHKRGVHAKG